MKIYYQIIGAIIVLLLLVGILISWPAYAKPPNQEPVQPGTGKTTEKVSPNLVALRQEYEAYRQSGSREPFKSSDPLVRVAGDLVVIDAVAAGDAAILRSDLEALGLQDASTFGQMVSGQLPISAIGKLATLDNLQFVRPAFAATGGGAFPGMGGATTGSGGAVDSGVIGIPGEKETSITQDKTDNSSSHHCRRP